MGKPIYFGKVRTKRIGLSTILPQSIGSYKPSGGYYSKNWILGAKNLRIDFFSK